MFVHRTAVIEKAQRRPGNQRCDRRVLCKASQSARPFAQEIVITQQDERGVEIGDRPAHVLGGRIVEIAAREADAGRHLDRESTGETGQLIPRHPARRAIAQDRDQGRHRAEQADHVDGVDGGRLQQRDAFLRSLGQIGEETAPHQLGQLPDRRGRSGFRDGRARGRLFDGHAVNEGFGKLHRQLRLPHQAPDLAKCAAPCACIHQPAPRHPKKVEPMQQDRLREPGLAAQIERDLLLDGLGLEAKLSLPLRKVDGKRHLRDGIIDGADRPAHGQARFNRSKGRLVAMAERRERRIPHLAQSRRCMAADRGQRDGEAGGLDGGSGRGLMAFGAQLLRDLGLPGSRERIRRDP